MASLRKEIDSLVEQFGASPELKASVKRKAERTAVRLMSILGPTKAAIVSVAEEFVRMGRNMAEVSLCISRMHPRIGQLRENYDKDVARFGWVRFVVPSESQEPEVRRILQDKDTDTFEVVVEGAELSEAQLWKMVSDEKATL